jgi:hypothetical protein
MPATLEPTTAPKPDALEAAFPGAGEFLDKHFAEQEHAEGAPAEEQAAPPAASPPPETPDGSQAPADTVEPHQDIVPEAPAKSPPATVEEAASNEPPGKSASWQPSEVARQTVRALGLSDDVVRGFSSDKDLTAALMVAIQLRQQQAAAAPASPPSPPAPKPKSKIEEFIENPINADDPLTLALKEMHDENAQMRASMTQFEQHRQAQAQQNQQAYFHQLARNVDETLDKLNAKDFFGTAKEQTTEQNQRRSRFFDKFVEFAQKGVVQDVSPESVEVVRFALFPAETKEQLRRELAAAAKAQANNSLPSGRGSSTRSTAPVADWANDKELQSLYDRLASGATS